MTKNMLDLSHKIKVCIGSTLLAKHLLVRVDQ